MKYKTAKLIEQIFRYTTIILLIIFGIISIIGMLTIFILEYGLLSFLISIIIISIIIILGLIHNKAEEVLEKKNELGN